MGFINKREKLQYAVFAPSEPAEPMPNNLNAELNRGNSGLVNFLVIHC